MTDNYGAGAITAGGCLGILIPPSVLLIVYGATAGVSVVQLYAGAFFPGIMLAGLYIVYVIVVAKIKPAWAPPLSAEQRIVPLPAALTRMGATGNGWALGGLVKGLKGANNHGVPTGYMLRQLGIVLLPALLFATVAVLSYQSATRVVAVETYEELQPMGAGAAPEASGDDAGGLAEPPVEEEGLSEPPSADGDLAEPPGADSDAVALPPGAEADTTEPPADSLALPPGAVPATPAAAGTEPAATTQPASQGYWIGLGVGALALHAAPEHAALRTLAAGSDMISERPSPALPLSEGDLSDTESYISGSLMRVNHTGEVCAQALYQGQALTAKLPHVRAEMEHAADEEIDHLVWCQQRIDALGSHTSYLNPMWYGLSFAIGAGAGLISDKVSLGFVAATEDQVC